jgi:hypothetical protein
MPRHLPWLLVASLTWLACSSGGSSEADTADVPAPDAAVDVAPDLAPDVTPDTPPLDVAPDAPPPDVTPDAPPLDAAPDLPDADPDAPDYTGVAILERPARVALTCTVLHDALPLADTWSYWMGADIAAVGADVLLVRGEGAGEQTKLVQSPLAVDGTLGAATTLATLPGWVYARPRVVATADRVAAVYVASDSQSRLGFVAADGAGNVHDGPAVLAGTNGLSDAAVVATADGYAVLGVASQSKTVRFLRLDAHGVVQGEPVDLPSQGSYVNWPAPGLVVVDGGFVATWTEQGTDLSAAAIARLDANGQVQGAVVRLAPADGGEGTRGAAVTPIEGGLLVAWTESHNPADWNEAGWTIVQVQRFTADLAPAGEVARVQDPSTGLTCHTPVWLDLGAGTPGLSFDCGVLYTICGGCVPTETIGLVALHPEDLVPASEKVLLKSSTGAGGLLNPRYVRQGDDWFVYTDLTYHALNQPALAAVRCL